MFQFSVCLSFQNVTQISVLSKTFHSVQVFPSSQPQGELSLLLGMKFLLLPASSGNLRQKFHKGDTNPAQTPDTPAGHSQPSRDQDFSKGFDFFSPLHPFLNSIQVKINTSTFSNVNSEPVASCVAAVNRLQDRLRGKISVSLKIDQLKTLKIVQALLPCPALCAGICSVL